MNDSCQRYWQDPEGNAAHPRECADCRAVLEALDVEVDAKPLTIGELPLAPWEGASYKPWPLVAGGAATLLLLALALYAVAGTTPLSVLSSEMSRLEMLRTIVRLSSAAVKNAPFTWQVTIGILFVIVNTILVLLLRRAPRGIDA